MNGSESLMLTLAASGVDMCFANPGTSEMHAVVALDKVDKIRPVLGLFEGAVTGMADGYARITGKPAATLLHLGSGLGNGIANLHNAKRAHSPVVNIVGDHALYHQQWDTPLASDIESLARPVSCWVRKTRSALDVAADGAQAVAAARASPGGIATLIVPADTAWNAAQSPAPPVEVTARPLPPDHAIDRTVELLRTGQRCVILARGEALLDEGLSLLNRICAASGAALMCDQQAPRLARGTGRPLVESVPYRAEVAKEHFADVAHLILVGTEPPVAAFAYPDYPSWVLPEGMTIHYLAHPHEDGVAALAATAQMLGAPRLTREVMPLDLPERPTGDLDQFSIGAVMARLMPEGAIISSEAATCNLGPMAATQAARPHDWLSNTGGAIGQGIPLATGAAIGAPGRRVINLQADGSGMYTLQALWTQAREHLDVVTILFANRRYAILEDELARVGVAHKGPATRTMFELDRPELRWTALAEGMGVEASRAVTVAEFEAQLTAALGKSGPHLIEAVV